MKTLIITLSAACAVIAGYLASATSPARILASRRPGSMSGASRTTCGTLKSRLRTKLEPFPRRQVNQNKIIQVTTAIASILAITHLAAVVFEAVAALGVLAVVRSWLGWKSIREMSWRRPRKQGGGATRRSSVHGLAIGYDKPRTLKGGNAPPFFRQGLCFTPQSDPSLLR